MEFNNDSGERPYIYNIFNLAEDSSNRLTNKWNRREQASFANENVQEYLVDTDELNTISKWMLSTGKGVLILHEKHRKWHQTELQQEQVPCRSSEPGRLLQ